TEPPARPALPHLAAVNLPPRRRAPAAEARERAGVAVATSVRKALPGELVPDAVNVAGGAIHEDVRPGIPLAERLGRVGNALADSSVTHFKVEVNGEIADKDVYVLKLSALKGLFKDVVSDQVSYVNAPLLAEERGIGVELTTDPYCESFRNITRLTATTSTGQRISVSGTVTGPKLVQKLTEVDGYSLEIELTDNLLIFRYEDRPG